MHEDQPIPRFDMAVLVITLCGLIALAVHGCGTDKKRPFYVHVRQEVQR